MFSTLPTHSSDSTTQRLSKGPAQHSGMVPSGLMGGPHRGCLEPSPLLAFPAAATPLSSLAREPTKLVPASRPSHVPFLVLAYPSSHPPGASSPSLGLSWSVHLRRAPPDHPATSLHLCFLLIVHLSGVTSTLSPPC